MGSAPMLFLKTDEMVDNLRDDTRFNAMLKRMDLEKWSVNANELRKLWEHYKASVVNYKTSQVLEICEVCIGKNFMIG